MNPVMYTVILGLLSALLVGTGPASAAGIEFWTLSTPVKEITDATVRIVEDFEAETGIDVNLVWIPREQARNKLVSSLAAGTNPDVYFDNVGAGIEFARRGLVYQTNDIVDEIGAEKFFPGLLQSEQFPLGVQWGVPIFARLSGLHFRKDWFREVGIDTAYRVDQDDNWYFPALDTWDNLLATAKKLTQDINGDGKTDRWGIGLQTSRAAPGDGNGWVQSFLLSGGSSQIDLLTDKVNFNSPETVHSVQYIRDLYHTHEVMPPGVVSWGEYENNLYFQDPGAAVAAMVMNSDSIRSWIQQNAPELNEAVGVTIQPKGPDGRKNLAGADSMIIFRNTTNYDAARRLVLYWLDTQRQQEFLKYVGAYSSPARFDVLTDPWFSNDAGDEYRMMVENNKYSTVWPGGITPQTVEVQQSNILIDMMTRVTADEWSAERAVEEAEGRIKRVYGER